MVTIKNIITATRCAKKIMIAVALQLYVLAPANSYAQNKINDNVIEAANVLKGINKQMSKQQALNVLKKKADSGNAYAMNAVGMAYMCGIGTAIDSTKTIKYLDLAGEKGNAESYHNLGMMYKNSQAGVAQNFKKACLWFEKGVNKGSVMCNYDLGFMAYKGLGCEQNYEKAVGLFQKASDYDIPQALYMLGLCYRNGYGVKQDFEKATFYLERAGKLGYIDALIELKRTEPENHLSETISDKNFKFSVPSEMPEINISVNDTSNISGNYKGYIVMYDWSGKYILGEKPILLSIDKSGNVISGKLSINKDLVSLKGEIGSDGCIKFADTHLKLGERYSGPEGVDYRLDYAQLELWPNKISGEFGLYSNLLREPERPMYIELERAGTANYTKGDTNSDETLSSISIAPNPFVDTFNATIELVEDVKNVQARFFSNTGMMEQVINLGDMAKGKHEVMLSPNIRNGLYVLNVTAGKQVLRTIISKKGGDR